MTGQQMKRYSFPGDCSRDPRASLRQCGKSHATREEALKGPHMRRSMEGTDTRKESIEDDERDDERRHGPHDARHAWHDPVDSPAGGAHLGTHYLAQSPVEHTATTTGISPTLSTLDAGDPGAALCAW